MRSAGLIEAGSGRGSTWPAGAGGRGGAGFRGIEPVTSGSLIVVEGSKNEELPPIELVGSRIGCRRRPARAFRRRHRPARRGRWRAASARRWRDSWTGPWAAAPGAAAVREQEFHRGLRHADHDDGDAGRDQQRLQEFQDLLAARQRCSAPSSIGIGGGIVEGIAVPASARASAAAGRRRGAWNCGSAGTSLAAFLNGHLSHVRGLRPSDFGTFTGRVEIGRLRGVARGGDGGRLAAGFRGHRPGIAERGLGGGDAGRGRAGLDARGAAAGLERRVGRQIGVDRLALRAARHLPRGRPRRAGRRAVRASARAAAARRLRRAAAAEPAAARRVHRAARRRCGGNSGIKSSGDCAKAGAGIGARRGRFGSRTWRRGRRGAGSAGGARRPRGPPLRISSR